MARVLVLVGALCIVALGLLGGVLGLLAGFVDPSGDLVTATTVSVSFIALTVGLGLSLAWHAWRSIGSYPASPFRPRRVWRWGLLFLLSVLGGHFVLSTDLAPPLTLPALHVAAATLPPMLILALVARRSGKGASWRDVVLQLGSGAFLSTFLAFVLESAVILSLLIVTLVAVAAQPGGLNLLQALAENLQDPAKVEALTQQPAVMADLAESPLITIGGFLLLAGLIPLLEESVKTVGVGLLAYRRPTPARAFFWGVTSGAGFALAEGMFNSAGNLDTWTPVVLLRVGATLMHCFTGGLMGLAWYTFLGKRQWRRGLGLYGACVGLHGVWNALAAGIALISLKTLGQPLPVPSQRWDDLSVLSLLILMFLLTMTVCLGLWRFARNVRKQEQAVQPATAPSEANTARVRERPAPPSGPPVERPSKEERNA